MSKKKSALAKIIKLIVSLAVYAIRITLTVSLRLFKKVVKDFSKRLRFSITFKTASVYAFILSTILLILSILIVSSFGLFLLYESRNSLQKSAQVTTEFLNGSPGIPESKLKNYADIQGITITLFNKQKNVTYTTEADKSKVTFIDNTDRSLHESITNQNMHFNTPAKISNDIYYIQVAKPLTKEIAYVILLLPAVAVIFIFAVIVTVLIGSRSSRRMLRPVDNMINTARSISDFHTRLDVVHSHDELKELAETFNEMLDRIQGSYEQQNQFVSDASHELRTPISVIQGYANLLYRWGKEDKEVLDESVNAIKNEADNMKDLVEKLLFLARADKNTQKIEKAPFSLNELVNEVVKETKLIDSEHNITSEVNEGVTMYADRGLIKQALRVFIDNSIKYTPAGGVIKINSQQKGSRAIFTIEDNGIGIPKEDLPFIFNRFYKCDKSRTREAGGTGLGLAIAKWIIDKHDGIIEVESALNRGTKIVLNLPV